MIAIDSMLLGATRGTILGIALGDTRDRVLLTLGEPPDSNADRSLVRYGLVEFTFDSDDIVRCVYVEVPYPEVVFIPGWFIDGATSNTTHGDTRTLVNGGAEAFVDVHSSALNSFSLRGPTLEPEGTTDIRNAGANTNFEQLLRYCLSEFSGVVLRLSRKDVVERFGKPTSETETSMLYEAMEFDFASDGAVTTAVFRVPPGHRFHYSRLVPDLKLRSTESQKVVEGVFGAVCLLVDANSGDVLEFEVGGQSSDPPGPIPIARDGS